MENVGRQVKPGDLVVIKNPSNKQTIPSFVGIITSWYDSPKNLVEVMWWLEGKNIGRNPIVANRLKVINECR